MKRHLSSQRRVRRFRSLLTALAATVPLTACADSAAETNHIGELPWLTFTPGLRIGDVNDPNLGFSVVSGIDVDADGNVYVGEALVPEIRLFDQEGRFLRPIGRRGGGPGEFQGSPRFGIVGDTLWTFDIRADRITLFDRGGNVLSSSTAQGVIIPLPESVGHLLPWSMRADGTFSSHFARVAYNRNAPPSGVLPTDSIPVPFVRFAKTGEVIDTIGWAGRPPPRMWRPPEQGDTDLKTVQAGGRTFIVPSPPTRMPYWEPLPDGYVLVEMPSPATAEEAAILVTRFGLAHDTIFHRELRYDPVPYGAADLDSIAARAARGDPGGMVPFVPAGSERPPVPDDLEAAARALRDAMEFPNFQNPVASVRVAQDESIWIQLSEVNAETADWILLDSEGRTRGRLELPTDVRPLWSRGDVLWVVERDEFDVPWVVRYALSDE